MRLFDCKCRKGREDQRVLVSLEVEIPASLYRRVNKNTLRRSDVLLAGAIWERSVWSCRRCGVVRR